MKFPTVRTDSETYIELDQTKNSHPFIHIEKGTLGEPEQGKMGWIIIVDSNEGGAVVGEGVGLAVLTLPDKRMRALRDFLNEVDLGDEF